MSDPFVLALAIMGCVLALALGIWLGLPGRYQQSAQDIEQIMEQGGARRRKVKRAFTPMAWLQRQVSARSSRGSGPKRGGFRMESPDDS